MSAVSLLLNVLRILFGGLWMAIGWIIAAVLMAITVVGLQRARAAFNIATYRNIHCRLRGVLNRNVASVAADAMEACARGFNNHYLVKFPSD